MSLKTALNWSILNKDGFLQKKPQEFLRELNNELIHSNFEHSRKINSLILLFSLILIPIDILNKQKGLWTPGSKYLFYTHVFMLIVTVTLFLFSRLYCCKDKLFMKQVFVMIFAYFITINCTLTSIIDQLIHGEITLYIVGAYTLAVMNTFKPFTSLVLYSLNYVLFIIGITLLQKNPVILSGHYINGTILVVVAGFLSFILYNAKFKDFLSRQTIEAQKAELETANQQLVATNQKLQESLLALDETQNMIFSLADALESKDSYTHGHSSRVAETAVELAKFLKLSETDQVNIYRAATLHDLGKIGIPDAILHKPSPLTDEEWSIMKLHPERGASICSQLNFAKEILPTIKHHHERFDGKGYPSGLKGADIPLFARIICIADTVDAMTSERPYRSAVPFDQVLAELQKCSGTQFDPNLVEAYITLNERKVQTKSVK